MVTSKSLKRDHSAVSTVKSVCTTALSPLFIS